MWGALQVYRGPIKRCRTGKMGAQRGGRTSPAAPPPSPRSCPPPASRQKKSAARRTHVATCPPPRMTSVTIPFTMSSCIFVATSPTSQNELHAVRQRQPARRHARKAAPPPLPSIDPRPQPPRQPRALTSCRTQAAIRTPPGPMNHTTPAPEPMLMSAPSTPKRGTNCTSQAGGNLEAAPLSRPHFFGYPIHPHAHHKEWNRDYT